MSDELEQFSRIFETQRNRVFKICLGFTGSSNEAEDLLQETFLKAWLHLKNFRNESSINTWICRIAVNTCLSYVKKKRSIQPISEKHWGVVYSESSSQKEQIDLLLQCIQKLKETERLIITLVMEEIPYSEIAEVMGVTEGTLRMRIHRIKIKLTEIYKSYERV